MPQQIMEYKQPPGEAVSGKLEIEEFSDAEPSGSAVGLDRRDRLE